MQSPFVRDTCLVRSDRAENVRRLVAITGIGDSVGQGGFLFDRVIFQPLLRRVYADKNRQEDITRREHPRRSGYSRIFRALWQAVRNFVLDQVQGGD